MVNKLVLAMSAILGRPEVLFYSVLGDAIPVLLKALLLSDGRTAPLPACSGRLQTQLSPSAFYYGRKVKVCFCFGFS